VVVGVKPDGSTSARASIQPEDRLVSIDNLQVRFFARMSEADEDSSELPHQHWCTQVSGKNEVELANLLLGSPPSLMPL
jgi:hypothetical protein